MRIISGGNPDTVPPGLPGVHGSKYDPFIQHALDNPGQWHNIVVPAGRQGSIAQNIRVALETRASAAGRNGGRYRNVRVRSRFQKQDTDATVWLRYL